MQMLRWAKDKKKQNWIVEQFKELLASSEKQVFPTNEYIFRKISFFLNLQFV